MKKLLLALICFPLLLACGLDNTMYNARTYFKTAQARPLSASGRPTPQAVAEYTKAIEKCGKILTERRNSPLADDALYLMSRALYYKGNSAFQAKEQFENFIKIFPDSPFTPEAHIYLAKVNREINKPKDAEILLEQFVRDPKYRAHHPKALIVLSEFEILDKDFHRAQYWLDKLLQEYPKTPEYNDAFFLFGKNYFVQGEYEKSLKELERLQDSRRVPKDLKLDTDYYIALNLYHLKQYPRGYRLIRRLINAEYRTEKTALARVLKARYQLAMGDAEAAKSEFDFVTRTYPRSAASAEANFYLAEHFFYDKGSITDAITNYNRVRTEFQNSALTPLAQQKSTALTQLNQKANLNSETNLQQFLDYHYLAADNYLSPLNLPDSTLVQYQRILSERKRFASLLDSLNIQILGSDTRIDSLMLAAKADSLMLQNLRKPAAMPNDNLATPVFIDSLATAQDTDTPSDSLFINPQIGIIESRLTETNAQIGNLSVQKRTLEQQIEKHRGTIKRFDEEIIPFTHFVKASFFKRHQINEAKVDSILSFMEEVYPDNKYTYATLQLKQGGSIRLIDRKEEALEKRLDFAFGLADSAPDSMRVILTELSESALPHIVTRAKFRLGWHYSFEARDTTAAKVYLDAVLGKSDSGDYGALIRRFYNGKNFLMPRLTVIDSLSAKADSLMKADSLYIAIPDVSDLNEEIYPEALETPEHETGQDKDSEEPSLPNPPYEGKHALEEAAPKIEPESSE